MLQLRDYQRDAVDSIFEYWSKNNGSPLVVVPTGGGKALLISTFVKELLRDYSDMRILCVTHVKELIVQNAKELLGIWPQAPIGFYSASVGRKDAHAQVIFGGVQTIYNKVDRIGHIDLVLVDESHLMPRKSETQYGKLISGLRAINPDMKLVGFTATPFRLGEGLLTEGEDALFDAIAYEKPVGELIDDGYLCRPVSKGMDAAYDLTGVGKLGGDYKQNALQNAVDKSDVNSAVCDEIVKYGRDRKAWLLFCSGVEHAYHMRDELRSRGISCETVCGDTPSAERDRILEDFKAGRIQAVTNNSVMTTGVNVPRIDLLALCRPTLSASLYIQMVGRGLRLYPGKDNCLVLDFAGNVKKHGPIDSVDPGRAHSGTGDAPVKKCPTDEADVDGSYGCDSLVHASARVCPDCGYKFPFDTSPKLDTHAGDAPILSKGEPQTRRVTTRTFRHHPGKGGKPDSVKATYMCGYAAINEWLCIEHGGPIAARACKFWREHGGSIPYPKTVMEWLERQSELVETDTIEVEPNGKYWNVKKWFAVDVDKGADAGVDVDKLGLGDSIPF